MPLNDAARDAMLDHYDTLVTHVSAHDGDPSTTGANEVVGGSYARQSITFAASSGGNLNSSNTPVIPIPAGTTITYLGLWSASTAGTFYGSADITEEVFCSAGNYTVDDFDVNLT